MLTKPKKRNSVRDHLPTYSNCPESFRNRWTAAMRPTTGDRHHHDTLKSVLSAAERATDDANVVVVVAATTLLPLRPRQSHRLCQMGNATVDCTAN